MQVSLEDKIKQLDALMHDEEVNDHIESVIKEFIANQVSIAHLLGKQTDLENGCSYSWLIQDHNVEIDWELNWRYGGHAEGTLSFMSCFLWDHELRQSVWGGELAKAQAYAQSEIDKKAKQAEQDRLEREEFERWKATKNAV